MYFSAMESYNLSTESVGHDLSIPVPENETLSLHNTSRNTSIPLDFVYLDFDTS